MDAEDRSTPGAGRRSGRARGDRGANLVEYALLVALVVLVCVAAVTLLGEQPGTPLSSLASGISRGSSG